MSKMDTTFSFDYIFEKVGKELTYRLENNKGLTVFAKARAKFEGWLKVELCDILSEYSNDIKVEVPLGELESQLQESRGFVDLVFNNEWAIELKVVNTSYTCEGIPKKTRPITQNINSIIDDILKLSQLAETPVKKAVIFVVFPLNLDSRHSKYWKHHEDNIKENVGELKCFKFHFKNGIPGILYFGVVS